MPSKKHHYVPTTYLKGFCNDDGKLFVRRKDDPGKLLHVTPNNIGYRTHYHSQPIPGGGMDHDRLETALSATETNWPSLVATLRTRDPSVADLEYLLGFVGLQRARVPATRDAIEASLASTADVASKRVLKETEHTLLSPEVREVLEEGFDIAINPHASIHAMLGLLPGLGQFFDTLGYELVRNSTNHSYLTSDNPVVWFNHTLPKDQMRPYAIDIGGPVTLHFPIASDLLLRGRTDLRQTFLRKGLVTVDATSPESVLNVNRYTLRFAYESVMGNEDSFAKLISEYSDICPVVRCNAIPAPNGTFIHKEMIWGQRQPKPKWTGKRQPPTSQ